MASPKHSQAPLQRRVKKQHNTSEHNFLQLIQPSAVSLLTCTEATTQQQGGEGRTSSCTLPASETGALEQGQTQESPPRTLLLSSCLRMAMYLL